MIDSKLTKEFIGRLVVSYKIGETIYAYDEITHGLYKFSIYERKVDMVISPQNIYCDSSNKIMGISKSKNELILIPLFLNTKWIFYDLNEKKIRYSFPIKSKICISGTITIGRNLFLIPSDIYNPIIVFSLDDMKVIKTYEKWNGIDRKEDEIYIWGASAYDDFAVFPIVNSKVIYCANLSNVNMIKLDIPDPIFSLSVYKNKIWVLPVSGKSIYALDFKGKIIEKVELSQVGPKISANRFNRIVVLDEAVYLLPNYGGNILAYQCHKKQLIQINVGRICTHGRLFMEEITPYWDFIIEDKILHILPRDCRYKKINVLSLENEEVCLYYGKNINYAKYWGMLGREQKKYIYDKRKSDLNDFLQYTIYSHESCLLKKDELIGRKVWEKVKKE